MRYLKPLGGVLCVVASLMALTACGSNSSDSHATAAATPAATTTGSSSAAAPTGTPFVVGGLCSCSGPFAGNLGKVSSVYDAWEKSVNAAGGLDGHPVKVIVYDDAADPSKGLTAARKLVEQDHVMAIIGHVSVVSDAWRKYVDQKGIPVVGGNPDAASLVDPNFYASGSPLPVQLLGQMQEMKKVGKKHFGVLYCAEAPACATVGALARKAASVAGGIAVSDGKIAGTQPKYTAQCLLMKNQGVDALMVASQSAVVLRVTSDCAAQGYKPLTTNQSADYSTEWLSSKDLEGAQIISPNAPYSDASLPAVKAFVDALNKYESGLTSGSQFGYATIFPWVGGQLFEAAVKQGGLTPDSKPADVAAAMYKLQGETLDGLSGPLTYVKGKPFVPACYWTTTINGGELVSGNSGKPTCLTAAQLKSLGLA